MIIKRSVFVLFVSLVTALGPAATIAHAAPSEFTIEEIAAMGPDEQAALLNPLRALANAADSVGRGDAADVYSGVELDAPHGIVDIYLTDLSRTDEFLAAAKRADETVDLDRANVKQGRYTKRELDQAADQAFGQTGELGFKVESVVVPADGSALVLRVADVAQANRVMTNSRGRFLSKAGDVADVAVVTEPAVQFSDMSRRRDQPDWIAGAAISAQSTPASLGYDCTSGLPVRRNGDNRPFLITAAHCFRDNVNVYTGWEGGGRNSVGRVAFRYNEWDAILVDTSSTGTTVGKEWDGPPDTTRFFSISGNAYSHKGDLVCQDGYTSGIVCGIQVTEQDAHWTGSNGVAHRGVEGSKVDGGTATRGGDSGGLVFHLDGNTRQARGIVSAGSTGAGTIIRWTETVDILNSFDAYIAP